MSKPTIEIIVLFQNLGEERAYYARTRAGRTRRLIRAPRPALTRADAAPEIRSGGAPLRRIGRDRGHAGLSVQVHVLPVEHQAAAVPVPAHRGRDCRPH